MDTKTADGKRPATGAEDEQQDTHGTTAGKTPGEEKDPAGKGAPAAAETDGDAVVDDADDLDADDEVAAEDTATAAPTGIAAGEYLTDQRVRQLRINMRLYGTIHPSIDRDIELAETETPIHKAV